MCKYIMLHIKKCTKMIFELIALIYYHYIVHRISIKEGLDPDA